MSLWSSATFDTLSVRHTRESGIVPDQNVTESESVQEQAFDNPEYVELPYIHEHTTFKHGRGAAGRPGEQQAPPQDLTVTPTGMLTVAPPQVDAPSAIMHLASMDSLQERHSGDGCATVLSSGGTSAPLDEAWQSCRDTLDSLSWVMRLTLTGRRLGSSDGCAVQDQTTAFMLK